MAGAVRLVRLPGGRATTPEVDESGLFLYPSVDENVVEELVFRPFSMLEPGSSVADSNRLTWTFEPPFRFVDRDGKPGEPAWPLEVPGHPARTRQLQQLDPNEQVETWTSLAGVEPTVFDIDWSSEED